MPALVREWKSMWFCKCGNDSKKDGFRMAQRDGLPVYDIATWEPPLYRCQKCSTMFNGVTMEPWVKS